MYPLLIAQQNLFGDRPEWLVFGGLTIVSGVALFMALVALMRQRERQLSSVIARLERVEKIVLQDVKPAESCQNAWVVGEAEHAQRSERGVLSSPGPGRDGTRPYRRIAAVPSDSAVPNRSLDQRYAQVYWLSDGGLSVSEIATKTGMHCGEVNLVLALRDTKTQSGGEVA